MRWRFLFLFLALTLVNLPYTPTCRAYRRIAVFFFFAKYDPLARKLQQLFEACIFFYFLFSFTIFRCAVCFTGKSWCFWNRNILVLFWCSEVRRWKWLQTLFCQRSLRNLKWLCLQVQHAFYWNGRPMIVLSPSIGLCVKGFVGNFDKWCF